MDAKKDKWIMSPFNSLFFAMLAFCIIILSLVTYLLRNESDMTKRGVLAAACAVTFVGFFVYKYYLSFDEEYNAAKERIGMGGFNWWGELPLHLCNINMMLIPIAVLTKSRPLESFCFFTAPLGAFMALVMPGEGFEDCSLLLPRMLGFFGTHCMIFIEGLAIVTLGLYKPAFSDIPITVVITFIITFCVSVINVIMRWTGLYPNANYFYTIETEGNFFFEQFHKWIPRPFFYILPCFAILAVYMALVLCLLSVPDLLSRILK